MKLKSGPLGGDQQLGAMITDGEVDVKALLRIAVVYNIPIACNRPSADFIISSPLLDSEYAPVVNEYTEYLERQVG